jgi:hypothetical protein
MALSKVFTVRYYTRNTGFFLFVFYFFFGIVPGNQLVSYHYALIMGFLTSPGMLLITLLIWLLYNLKCMAYVQKTLSARENTFLYATLGILEGPRKWRTLYWLHFSLYAPVLVYSFVAILIALKTQAYVPAIIILFFNIIMTIMPMRSYDHKIKHPGTTPFFSDWIQWLNRRFRKPLWMFYIYELLNGNVKALALTKFAGALILLMACSFIGDQPDKRVVLVGLLINLLAHSVLIFNHRSFDDLYLSTLPQLPLPLWKRYVQTGTTYLFIMLPEFILLLFKTGPADLLLYITFGISILMLMRSLLYFPQLDQDKYFRWVFLIIVAGLFLSLAYYYWYAAVLFQFTAFVIFYFRYYRYEAPLQEVQ